MHMIVACVPPNNGPLYQVSGVCWIPLPLTVPEMLVTRASNPLTIPSESAHDSLKTENSLMLYE